MKKTDVLSDYTIEQKAFMSYIRTKKFLQTRFRDNSENIPVYLCQVEITKRFFYSDAKLRQILLGELVDLKELTVFDNTGRKSGNTYYTYDVLNPEKWVINPYLIKVRPAIFDDTFVWMRDVLLKVSMQSSQNVNPYFAFFLRYRFDLPDLFFGSDGFSGRIHTPVTCLQKFLRKLLIIDSEATESIDVVTMAPLILGKVLLENIGNNRFSDLVGNGKDIYSVMVDSYKLHGREQGKIMFYQLVFSKPNSSLEEVFGNESWVQWINHYKTIRLENNPHNQKKPHSNLAWLLQTLEVQIMKKIWDDLAERKIQFLTVHDEIIFKHQDVLTGKGVMTTHLQREFEFFQLKGS